MGAAYDLSMRTDGQTGMTKLIVDFGIIAHAPQHGLVKNWVFNLVKCSRGNSVLFRDYTEIYTGTKTLNLSRRTSALNN